MPIVDVTSLTINQKISFHSKETNDTVVRIGKIKSIGNHEIVRAVGVDIVPRYQKMRKQYPELLPLEELIFFIIAIEQEGLTSNYVIARDWIEPTSIQILKTTNYHTLRISDIQENQLTEVIDLLRSHHYVVSVEKK